MKESKSEGRKKPLPVVRLKPHTYQPSKAELEEPIILPGDPTPEDLARALLTPVRVIRE